MIEAIRELFQSLIAPQLEGIRGDIRALDSKIDALDEKFDSRIDALDEKFDSKIDALDQKFEFRFEALDAKTGRCGQPGGEFPP